MKRDICNIRTTVHVRADLARRLAVISARRSCSVDCLVRTLILRKIRFMRVKGSFSSHAVMYQDSADEWNTVHVSFSPIEYDMLFDARKVFRRSISLILLNAIEELLDDLDLPDSYPVKAYTKCMFQRNSVYYYLFVWGLVDTNQEITVPLE
ncbi:MAG: hypothetical protein ACOC2H_00475 [Spirochaetota bacterium]